MVVCDGDSAEMFDAAGSVLCSPRCNLQSEDAVFKVIFSNFFSFLFFFLLWVFLVL